jgi:hypothetical protein
MKVNNNYEQLVKSNAQFDMPEVVGMYAIRDRHATCSYFTKNCLD